MKLCDVCHRHVRASDGACPFCGRSLRTTGAARLGAVVLLGALEAACSSRPIEETASDGTSTSTSTSTTTTTSGEPVPSSATATASATTLEVTTTVSSSSGELSSSSDIDTSDSGCSFYGGCPTDFGSALECDLAVQDCPAGQKCAPFAGTGSGEPDSTQCVPVARDPDKPGEPCTVEGSPFSGIDSCDGGSVCWNVDPDTLAGRCVALCDQARAEPCADDHACVAITALLDVCAPHCDPLAPACQADEVCILDPDGDSAQFVCIHQAVGDGGAAFQPCEFLNACGLGLACIEPDAAVECDESAPGCCLPFCDLGQPDCAGEGAQCVAWFEPGQAPPGLADVGVCRLP